MMQPQSYPASNPNNLLSVQTLKPEKPHHTRQKTPVKIYNSNLNKFDYEVNMKHKRNQLSDFNNIHTPSNVSVQSMIIHNDIQLTIPCVRELIFQAECKDESVITRHEAFLLLKKLRIVTHYSNSETVFKYLNFSKDRLKIEEFFMFLTADLSMLDFQSLSKEELILKFGIEVFRAVGKESTELKIMDAIQYLKDHKTLGFDLTQIFELFDFYKSEISGSLKNKLTINGFFNKSAPILYQVFSPEYVLKLRQIISTIRQDPLRSQQLNSPLMIKSYDPEKNRTGRQSLSKKLEQEIFTAHRMENQTTESVANKPLNTDMREPDLEDVFFEVHPKNKGWLMRRSKKHSNKWAMVFCEITEGRLVSAQPTSLQKSMEIKNVEIHKCNFLEIMNRFDFGQGQNIDDKKGHKRTGSHGYKLERGPARENIRLDFCFFILDKKNQKTYLIRSPENLIIGSIIHFYLHKDKYTNLCEQIFSPLFVIEPEFSGVIEIAICKRKNIGRYHSNLKSYTFKKQFLIIKNGKFNIYDMKLKDNISLCEYEVKQESQLDILPQTNPFVFTLEKLDSRRLREMNLQMMKESLIDEGEEIRTNQADGLRPARGIGGQQQQLKSGQIRSPNPEFYELAVVEEKKSKGFFQDLFKGILGGGAGKKKKNKEERITLACDTEMKRRQWILTLNYFIMQHIKMYTRPKPQQATNKETKTNVFEELARPNYSHAETAFTNDPNMATLDKKKKKNKPSLSLRNGPQENPDFYDVFTKDSGNLESEAENKTNNLQPGMIQPSNQSTYNPKAVQNTDNVNSKSKKALPTQQDKSNLPLITEPDANNPLDSEEILLTFTQFNAENLPTFLKNNPNANNQINLEDPMYLFTKEIKTLSDVELWQKFLIFFLKEKHACAHFDLQEEFPNDPNRDPRPRNSIDSSRFETELIEDEPVIRRVLTDQYNNNFIK